MYMHICMNLYQVKGMIKNYINSVLIFTDPFLLYIPSNTVLHGCSCHHSYGSHTSKSQPHSFNYIGVWLKLNLNSSIHNGYIILSPIGLFVSIEKLILKQIGHDKKFFKLWICVYIKYKLITCILCRFKVIFNISIFLKTIPLFLYQLY